VSAQKKKKRPSPAAKRSRNSWVFPAVIVAIVVIGVVAVALTAMGGNDSGSSGPKNAVQVSAEVSVDGSTLPDFDASAAKDPAVGLPAPEIGSVNFRGKNVQAGGATGSPYAVVFLAHWCPHCQAEMPRLVSAAENGQIAGVDVIGVATGTSDTNPNYPPSEWFAREDWPFAVMVDDASSTAASAYGLTGYPYMVFVDAEGNVVGRTSGEIAEDDLQAIFEALAAGDPIPIPGAGASSSN
jgi:thiol-disulfide isomerase/thioredoxin